MGSYKGYKSERAFYNAKIHGLAILIAGPQNSHDLIKGELRKIIDKRISPPNMFDKPGTESVTDLRDQEARQLYYDLLNTCQKVKANIKTTNSILGLPGSGMTDRQRKKLIRITKYKFNWSAEVTFSKFIEICPKLAKRLTPWQIKNTKLLPLFNLMSNGQADKIIKRLEKIEERNKESEH